MTTVAEAAAQYAVAAPSRPGGVWAAAWGRLRNDRVGMVCLGIVGAFGVLILLTSLGLMGSDWQLERGVIYAPPTFVGADAGHKDHVIDEPTGPRADLADVDPLAPRYAEWKERAARFLTAEAPKAETLPFGGDRLGRDVLTKALKGAQVSIFVGVLAALLATLIGTLLGALGGYAGGRVGDFLEWVYNVFT